MEVSTSHLSLKSFLPRSSAVLPFTLSHSTAGLRPHWWPGCDRADRHKDLDFPQAIKRPPSGQWYDRNRFDIWTYRNIFLIYWFIYSTVYTSNIIHQYISVYLDSIYAHVNNIYIYIILLYYNHCQNFVGTLLTTLWTAYHRTGGKLFWRKDQQQKV